MSKLSRRNVLQTGLAFAIPPAIASALAGCNQTGTAPPQQTNAADDTSSESQDSKPQATEASMKIQYLEIVTPEVDALCKQYAAIYDITFSEPVASFGGARTAKLDGGGQIGIRGPLRDSETPVVRPYVLVDDIEAAVKAASEAGGEVAMPPMEIPENGMFAIVIHGGIECGFWQT